MTSASFSMGGPYITDISSTVLSATFMRNVTRFHYVHQLRQRYLFRFLPYCIHTGASIATEPSTRQPCKPISKKSKDIGSQPAYRKREVTESCITISESKELLTYLGKHIWIGIIKPFYEDSLLLQVITPVFHEKTSRPTCRMAYD